MVRLDRLVRDDAGQDQLPAAARAPVVRLCLADRQLDVAARDLAVEPDRRAARGDADVRVLVRVPRLVLEELDPQPLHAVEVLAAELLLDVRLGHREDLAVRADDDGLDPGGLDGVEHGRQQLRLRRRPELVVDHDRKSLLPASSSEKRGPVTGDSSAVARRLGRVCDRLGLLGVDRGEDVLVRDLELELVAVDLAVVAGRADRERIERLVRNPVRRHRSSALRPRCSSLTARLHTVRALRLNHVSIHADDLEESARFYERVFGMERLPTPRFQDTTVIWLRLGDQQLHLFTRETGPPRYHHFGLEVDDFDGRLPRGEGARSARSEGLRPKRRARAPGRLRADVPPRSGRQPRRGRLAGRLDARPRRF